MQSRARLMERLRLCTLAGTTGAGGRTGAALTVCGTTLPPSSECRIEDYKAAGTSPRITILDGARLYRKLQHPQRDVYHVLSEPGDYKADKDGQM
eukprot:3519766-Pyramimonas_sp.AAC.1